MTEQCLYYPVNNSNPLPPHASGFHTKCCNAGILTEVALAVVIGFYLLSRTWHSVCKPAEADKVFKTVDVDQNGFLSGNDIKLLLVGMGNPVAASKHYFGNVLAEMKGMPQESFRTKLPKWCGGKEAENSWIAHASISPQEFEDWCTDNQYRATVGIYVFTVQTFAFVMRQESDFSTLELFNMDVQAAVKVSLTAFRVSNQHTGV